MAELLGDDIYEAAPKWALKGAELAGELPLIHGAVGAASRVMPRLGGGVAADIARRAGIGGIAGVSLGAGCGLVEGDPDWVKHSLMEGLIFGGLEAGFAVPQLLRNVGFARMAKRNKALLAKGVSTAEEAVSGAHTPDALNLAEDHLASFRGKAEAAPEWAGGGRTPAFGPPERPKGVAELISQAELRDAMVYQHMEPMTQTPAHDLWMRHGRDAQSFIVQTPMGETCAVMCRYAGRDAVGRLD